MTTQEAYDTMRTYFSQPGATLAKTVFGCRYRMDDGRKCAIGCLIPDELYDPSFDKDIGAYGNLVEWLAAIDHPLLAILDHDKTKHRFLTSAQVLHDGGAQDAQHFVELLDVLAAGFALQVSA